MYFTTAAYFARLFSGYYSRLAAIRALLLDFLTQTSSNETSSTQKCQILILGAGYDTTFFQLVTDGTLPRNKHVSYIELDFHDVTQKKAFALKNCPPLHETLKAGNRETEGQIFIDSVAGEVISPAYSLLPADLRNLDQVEKALIRAGFDNDAPTFVLAECVLVYMEPEESRSLVSWLGQRLTTSAFAVYEQVNPDDAFGRQMMMNLSLRGWMAKG